MTVRAFVACVLAFLTLSTACSGDTPAADSGLVVSIESDLSVPKDIDRMQWEVTQGERTLLHDKQVIGAGRLPLPAEFKIGYPGNDRPVTVRVVAFKSSRQRIERIATASVPSTRWAVLRMGIDFLCDGALDPEASCDGDRTCVGGTCSDPNVDEADLPDYVPAAPSGKAKPARGTKKCFDVAACFDGAATAKLADDCSIELNADVSSDQLNVGLALGLGGDGVCGATACYVPLDQGPNGWSFATGRVSLPSAVCRRRVGGQDLSVVISNACPAKTSDTPICDLGSKANGIGTDGEGSTRTSSIMPTEFVSDSCGGPSGRECGMCGTQLRECNTTDHTWSDYGDCNTEGECTRDMTEPCQRNGTRACGGDCRWGACLGQTCEGPLLRACGNCGTQRRTCDNGVLGEWSACTNEGVCAPNATQRCGANGSGTQACGGNCEWGPCGDQSCDGAPSEACGNCGSHSRTCDAASGAWSAFGACAEEGECAANEVQSCGRGGMKTCGGDCKWDPACSGQSCDGKSTQACGNCGTQSRTCAANSGEWSDWGPCNDEGECTPDATRGCGLNGTQFCAGNCRWESTCSGQSCVGSNQQRCGNCGTQTRVCNGNSGEWSEWSACSDEGECRPNTVQNCGSGGTQVCTASCQWPAECTDQKCAGPASEPCGNCGVRSRICNASTGRYSDWSACTDQGECKPQSHETCGSQGTRVCGNDCKWSDACTGQTCIEPKTRACGNCGTETSTCDSNTGRATWSTCRGEGKCSPGEPQMCGSEGMRICGDDCQWPTGCMQQVCKGPPPTAACGKCGVRTSRCDTDTAEWHFVDGCAMEKACLPKESRSCGPNGTGSQTCDDSCTWGKCEIPCKEPPMRACGSCDAGVQLSTCDTTTGKATWSECVGGGACMPGDSQSCTVGTRSGTHNCTQSCQWPKSCELICPEPATRSCGACGQGTETGVCDPATGMRTYGDCVGATGCMPGAKRACGPDGLGEQTCGKDCKWSEACDCVGSAPTGICPNCGVFSSTCNRSTGEWDTQCIGGGVCEPDATQPCGTERQGIQTCSDSCQWKAECECTGEAAAMSCGACGVPTTSCNTKTGTWQTVCTGGGSCEPGTTKACGPEGQGKQTCGKDCEYSKVCDCDPATKPSGECGNCGTVSAACDTSNGTWKSECSGSGCEPGTKESCGEGGQRTCGKDCKFPATCDCDPVTKPTGACGTCKTGTYSSTCTTAGSWEATCVGGDVDLQSDAKNCGACGNDCKGEKCTGGKCEMPCLSPRMMCGEACVDLGTKDHCSSCAACATGENCESLGEGAYRCEKPAPECKDSEVLCGDTCFALGTNTHCNSCKACSDGEVCKSVNGAYVCSEPDSGPTCDSGQQPCGKQCFAIDDHDHCGSCTKKCLENEICQGSTKTGYACELGLN